LIYESFSFHDAAACGLWYSRNDTGSPSDFSSGSHD
jgi:hypothetical protein